MSTAGYENLYIRLALINSLLFTEELVRLGLCLTQRALSLECQYIVFNLSRCWKAIRILISLKVVFNITKFDQSIKKDLVN
jgi:hypothetical protein